jgi:hypothetical protein
MDKLLTLRAALIATAFLLAGFGIHNAFLAVFSQGKFEVIYNYDETVRMCIESNCVYSAELAIANTGEVDQESVAVQISHIPGGIRGSPRVLNLSAAEPRQADPRIDSAYEEGVAKFSIIDFTPGTLVLIKFSGFYPQAENLDERPAIEVTAKGRVIEGDPRAVTFGRYVTSNP